MHDVAVTQTAQCRIQFRLLPDDCRPAYVVRHRGVTLVAVDPRSTRGEMMDWAPSYLFTQEREVIRRAYGQPPVGGPTPAAEPADSPYPTDIPVPLRLPPGHPPEVIELDRAPFSSARSR